MFLAQTSWDDAAPHTDIDTLILGPSANSYQLFGGSSPIGAPYVLDTVGASPNTFTGSGKWAFNTASGGASDLVTAPVQQGVTQVLTHGVLFEGDKFWVPFQTTVGGARVAPTSVEQTTASDSGSFDASFTTGVDLPGLSAEAFGLSQPRTCPRPSTRTTRTTRARRRSRCSSP